MYPTTYTGGGLAGIGVMIIGLINSVLVPLLFAIAFIVFIYGVAKTYIFSNGDEGAVEQGHKLILWGLVGFFVMISVWGLVNIVVDTFGLSGQRINSTPTFTPSSSGASLPPSSFPSMGA
jgi:hypothetical protein